MTCIAWDSHTLAADKRACSGSMICTVTKIHRIGEVLFGGSGDLDFVQQMLNWVREGRDIAKFPEAQRTKDDWQPTLVIEADGTPSVYNRSPYPVRYEQRCCAIGSGREYAMAAMHLGRTAIQAVEVAIALDPCCGNGIDVLTLGELGLTAP